MKIPKLFLHDTLTDWLHTLFFQGECVGSETIWVSPYYAYPLNPPQNAQYALLIVEAFSLTADKTKVIRFREDGTAPDASYGMPLGNMGAYEVKGKENMQRFRMIGIEPSYFHQVNVQYYG
jgi:hypothetical protein